MGMASWPGTAAGDRGSRGGGCALLRPGSPRTAEMQTSFSAFSLRPCLGSAEWQPGDPQPVRTRLVNRPRAPRGVRREGGRAGMGEREVFGGGSGQRGTGSSRGNNRTRLKFAYAGNKPRRDPPGATRRWCLRKVLEPGSCFSIHAWPLGIPWPPCGPGAHCHAALGGHTLAHSSSFRHGSGLGTCSHPGGQRGHLRAGAAPGKFARGRAVAEHAGALAALLGSLAARVKMGELGPAMELLDPALAHEQGRGCGSGLCSSPAGRGGVVVCARVWVSLLVAATGLGLPPCLCPLRRGQSGRHLSQWARHRGRK